MKLQHLFQTLTRECSLAEKSGSNLHRWLILVNLAEVNSKLGAHKDAVANLHEARKIVERIAESLCEVGFRDPFLNQPRVEEWMRPAQ